MTVHLRTQHLWYCPNCQKRAETGTAIAILHPCPGTRNLAVPMTAVGTRVRIYARDPDDYADHQHHDEITQRDPQGRPVMALVTERQDGSNDAIVYPRTAVAHVG